MEVMEEKRELEGVEVDFSTENEVADAAFHIGFPSSKLLFMLILRLK